MCGYTALSERAIKAVRKPGRCVWCGEPIEVGQPAVETAGVMDGEFQRSRYHPECDEASGKHFRESGDDCFSPYEFRRGTTEEA